MSISSIAPATKLRHGLSATEAAHWREHGWVAVPDFFTPAEVTLLRAELKALQDHGKLRNVATNGDGLTPATTVANLQICPVHPHSRPIRALVYAAKVRAAVTALLGDSAFHLLDQVFLKPGRHGAGTNWHTDNAYFHSAVVEAGTGLWIALHDANRANGTMQILPGSHRQPLAHRRDPGSDHHITCADAIDPAQARHIELPAGGVLFFNFGIAHATGANTTNHERAGLALHFLQAEHLSASDAWTTSAAEIWQRQISSSGDGGQHRFGEDFRGVWETLVG